MIDHATQTRGWRRLRGSFSCMHGLRAVEQFRSTSFKASTSDQPNHKS
jgi:hypothetical protein